MPENLKKIILAEDDPDDLDFFQSALNECCDDFELIVAKDGSELEPLLKKFPNPFAIVLDLNMPLVSGKECLQLIRSKSYFDNTPVLILSTSNDQKDKHFCLSNGANDYLVKPCSYNGLKEVVENLCKGAYATRKPDFLPLT